MYIPLTANRLVTSLLTSLEAILIPACLKLAGHSPEEALSVYGIFSGMAFPFIMFPTTITASIAVMLLPAVSEAKAQDAYDTILSQVTKTLLFSFVFGFYCTAVFYILGGEIGLFFFQSAEAGEYLTNLSFLCPLLSLVMTLSSVMNGLGKTTQLFYHNMISICIRVLCVLILIPRIGINGYFIGHLLSSLITVVLHLHVIKKEISLKINTLEWVLKPALVLFLCVGFMRLTQSIMQTLAPDFNTGFFFLLFEGICITLYYIGGEAILHLRAGMRSTFL